ncbi:MoaD/ThiS family protein [Paraliomyxa miuraensis]|uniref:MoaD/ThiS family protein n=1 Tax=Paraliomyxa miuraensis TaxID=376150 RepID=UPI00225647CF|nr:MoaD/ThiS family protein [Paraliomyxa miuraensis]MCX4242442.1 MoaD/ThiS family protein [Paraliomyxa miuraensis]
MNIVLSGTLQKFAQYQREHSIDAWTIQEGLDHLVKAHPALGNALFDGAGELRRAHLVFLNGDQVTSDRFSERVGERDEIEILTAIAGG